MMVNAALNAYNVFCKLRRSGARANPLREYWPSEPSPEQICGQATRQVHARNRFALEVPRREDPRTVRSLLLVMAPIGLVTEAQKRLASLTNRQYIGSLLD